MEERVARWRERGQAARNEKKDGREREWDSDESQAHPGEWSRTSMFELIQQPCLCCVLCKCSAMMKQRGRSFNGLTLLVWVEHPHSSRLLTVYCAFSEPLQYNLFHWNWGKETKQINMTLFKDVKLGFVGLCHDFLWSAACSSKQLILCEATFWLYLFITDQKTHVTHFHNHFGGNRFYVLVH